MAVTTIALDLRWMTIVLAYGFVARVLAGPTLSPLAQLVTRVLTPALGREPRLVPGPPKRFAQGIGAAVTVTAAVLTVRLRPVRRRAGRARTVGRGGIAGGVRGVVHRLPALRAPHAGRRDPARGLRVVRRHLESGRGLGPRFPSRGHRPSGSRCGGAGAQGLGRASASAARSPWRARRWPSARASTPSSTSSTSPATSCLRRGVVRSSCACCPRSTGSSRRTGRPRCRRGWRRGGTRPRSCSRCSRRMMGSGCPPR